MGRSFAELNTGAGNPSAPETPSTPENVERKQAAVGAKAKPNVTSEQRDNPKPKFIGGIAKHPITGAVLASNKWHSSWVGVSGYTEPKPLTEAAAKVQKVGNITIIPKQKGATYIPAKIRGPRPELPHREVDYDGSAINLTAEQKQQNKMATDSRANWDAHEAVEHEHKKAGSAADQVLAASNRQAAPKSTQLSETLDSDYAAIDASQLDSRGQLADHHSALTELHARLAPLVHLGGHLHSVSKTMAKNSAANSAKIAGQLNELNADGTPKIKEGSERREILLDGLNQSDQRSNDLDRFGPRHLKVMNSVAEGKRHLDGAAKALASGRDDDARRLLAAAAGHFRKVTAHLASPITRGVFVESGHPLHEDLANGLDKSNVEDIRSQIGDSERASSGVRNPNPEPLRFNYRGMIHTYPLNKDGLAKAKKHFGTLHDNYRKLQDAITANRNVRTPLSEAARDVVQEPGFRQKYDAEGKPVGEAELADIPIRKPAERQPATEAAQARRPIPDKPATTFAPDIQTHTKIAVKHIMSDMQIPYETQRMLGKSGLEQLRSWAKNTHGKDIIT